MASILDTITPQDFKDYFKRGFIYASIWNNTSVYNTNNVVFYEETSLYYRCLNANVSSTPITTTDWIVLPDTNYILDSDIEQAYQVAYYQFNKTLFQTEASAKIFFLYITAHALIKMFRLNGLSASSSEGLTTSKKVSDVSVNYAYATKVLDSVFLSDLKSTTYGNEALRMVYSALSSKTMLFLVGTTTPD